MTRKKLIIWLWNITEKTFKNGAEFYRDTEDIPTVEDVFCETKQAKDKIYELINEYTETIQKEQK